MASSTSPNTAAHFRREGIPRITAATKPPVRPNPLAKISNLDLPEGVSRSSAAAVILRVDVCVLPVPGKVILAGVKEQVILAVAALEQVRLIVPTKPLISVMVTVDVPACPAAPDVTNASKAKSWVGVTAVHAEIKFATSSDPSPVT